jgi:hypothetical protein
VRPSEPRRRRSRPEITLSRPADEVTESMAVPSPHPHETRRRRASRPAIEDLTPAAPAVFPAPDPTPFPDRETVPADVPRLGEHTDEIDMWPTQSLMGDDLNDPPDEKTRIGVPAYEASAKLATEAPHAQRANEPALRASQALRVVVWRAGDGVHVAPQGTRVAAITVDAVLVALDPSADLAAWLSGK